MVREKKPILTDKFLDELAKEINELYGKTDKKQEDEIKNNEHKTSTTNFLVHMFLKNKKILTVGI